VFSAELLQSLDLLLTTPLFYSSSVVVFSSSFDSSVNSTSLLSFRDPPPQTFGSPFLSDLLSVRLLIYWPCLFLFSLPCRMTVFWPWVHPAFLLLFFLIVEHIPVMTLFQPLIVPSPTAGTITSRPTYLRSFLFLFRNFPIKRLSRGLPPCPELATPDFPFPSF